jgi:hypothetical protein
MPAASPAELITINSLLIERDAAFARVHTLESQISELLGEAFPFEAPNLTLPSTLKRKPSKPPKAKRQAKALKPRRLNEGEAAYRITYIEKGQTSENTVTDLRGLEPLFAESLFDMQLLKIETIDFQSQTIATLFLRGDSATQ